MADRYFPNTLSDYVVPLQNGSEDSNVPVEAGDVMLKAAIALRDEVVQATWIRYGPRVSDPTMYVGMLGTAFLCFKIYETTGSKEDLDLCCEIVDNCATAAETMKQYVTFMCGQPGIYALGAAAAKCKGDQQRLDRYLGLFNAIVVRVPPGDPIAVDRAGFDTFLRYLYGQIAEQSVLAVGPEQGGLGMPYELMYGRAGFLWAALFVNKHVGEEIIPSSVTGPVIDAVLAAGRAGASNTQCPLMYQWHGTRYWGAAHGLAGIMHVLMHFPLNQEDMDDVKGTLRYMIKGRFSSGNYPSSESNTRDRLVHWCHGTPGLALTLCKAAQVYPECEEFRLAAIEAGEVVWKRGLLRRLGLCHGISGNAYVFLSLYRLFGGKKHLFRAQQFGCFLYKNAKVLIASGELHGGDHGYSLFEGSAGTACMWLDLTRPDTSRFPGYEL